MGGDVVEVGLGERRSELARDATRTQVGAPSLRTPDSSGRVAAMLAAFLDLLAASEKTAAEEGRDIVLSMLVVGLIFVGRRAPRGPVPARRPQAAQAERAALDPGRVHGA